MKFLWEWWQRFLKSDLRLLNNLSLFFALTLDVSLELVFGLNFIECFGLSYFSQLLTLLFRGFPFNNSTLTPWRLYLRGALNRSLIFFSETIITYLVLLSVSIDSAPVSLAWCDKASWFTWLSSSWIDFYILFIF